jgi:hypothetical protein
MYGENHVSFEFSAYQKQIIAEVDALLSGLPEGSVDESRSGVSLACSGQQHAPVPGQPDAHTICYAVVPSAPDAAKFALTIGAVSPVSSVDAVDGFYWEINNSVECVDPLLTSVIPLCESIVAGRLKDITRYRGNRQVALRTELEVPGFESPLVSGWSHTWFLLMFWLGPVREESQQYAPWAP